MLVTGGAGFVGSHVVELLVEAGCSEILVVDNLTSGVAQNLFHAFESGRVKLVVGDIRDEELMKGLIHGADTVFHLAALDQSLCIADPRLAVEVMAGATFRLFELCVTSKVRKIILSSCASVYGNPRSYPTEEDHDHYENRTIFGAIKSFSEALLRSFNEMYGTNYVALRYFDIYGPRMCLGGRQAQYLPTWIDRIENGLPPILVGDGRQTLDLLHVEDAARANILAATSSASDIAINIGSGQEITYATVVRMLSRFTGRTSLEPLYWQERPFHAVTRRLADVRAARRMIGFHPEIPLAAGLQHFVEWWRERSIERPF